MILITGATGRTGAEVVRALLERGEHVRAFVRDAERARSLLGDDVELAVGDLADAASVRAALAGADRLFLSCADDPRRVAWESALIDEAAAAGVQRIVKLSSPIAEPGHTVVFWSWHGEVEQHLRRSGVPSVILRAGFSMGNLLFAAGSIAHEGRIYAPAGDARIAMIDPRDVGAAAAAALAEPGHEGRTYALTGPAAVSYAEVADAFGDALGRPVAFVDIPDEAARQAIVGAGLPELFAEQFVRIFALARHGAGAHVTPSVEVLTGRPPRDVLTFARDHAALFTPELQAAGR